MSRFDMNRNRSIQPGPSLDIYQLSPLASASVRWVTKCQTTVAFIVFIYWYGISYWTKLFVSVVILFCSLFSANSFLKILNICTCLRHLVFRDGAKCQKTIWVQLSEKNVIDNQIDMIMIMHNFDLSVSR